MILEHIMGITIVILRFISDNVCVTCPKNENTYSI